MLSRKGFLIYSWENSRPPLQRAQWRADVITTAKSQSRRSQTGLEGTKSEFLDTLLFFFLLSLTAYMIIYRFVALPPGPLTCNLHESRDCMASIYHCACHIVDIQYYLVSCWMSGPSIHPSVSKNDKIVDTDSYCLLNVPWGWIVSPNIHVHQNPRIWTYLGIGSFQMWFM